MSEVPLKSEVAPVDGTTSVYGVHLDFYCLLLLSNHDFPIVECLWKMTIKILENLLPWRELPHLERFIDNVLNPISILVQSIRLNGDIQHYQETDLEVISGDVKDFGPNLKYILILYLRSLLCQWFKRYDNFDLKNDNFC